MLKIKEFYAVTALISALALAACGEPAGRDAQQDQTGLAPDAPGMDIGPAAPPAPGVAEAPPAVSPRMSGPAEDYGEPAARADLEFANQASGAASAWLFEAPEGVRVYVRARGMTPGTYAIHVHETGDCSAPDFTSAGDHLGEYAGQVLPDRPEDFDAGALPDIVIGEDGSGTLDAVLDALTMRGAADDEWAVLDDDGAAIVIHRLATADVPEGVDNPRIACGEIYESDL